MAPGQICPDGARPTQNFRNFVLMDGSGKIFTQICPDCRILPTRCPKTARAVTEYNTNKLTASTVRLLYIVKHYVTTPHHVFSKALKQISADLYLLSKP